VTNLLTTREVAAWLGLSPETVLRRWRAGELPGYRLASNVLRFDPDDVLAYLRDRRSEAPCASSPGPVSSKPGSIRR
jgi:excisionase family DNA binding protein